VLHIKTELGNRKISEPGQESPDLTNERKKMSVKTLRKRIALVAVSALGAGVLSLVAVPSANAAVAPGSLANDSLYIAKTRSATGAAAANSGATGVDSSMTQVGWIADTSSTAMTTADSGTAYVIGSSTIKTATVYPGAQIAFVAKGSSTASDGTTVTVTGGTLSSLAATATSTVTLSGATNINSAGTTVTVDDTGSETIYGVFTVNAAVGSVATISVFTGANITGLTSATSGTMVAQLQLTVASASAAGVYSAADSTVTQQPCLASADATTTNAYDTVTSCRNGYVGSVYVKLKDAYGTYLTGTISATASNNALITNTTAAGTGASVNSATSSFTSVAGGQEVWLYVKQPTSNTAGSSVVTISYNGTNVGTKTIKWFGDVATLDVDETNSCANFSTNQADDTTNIGGACVIYVAKDAAGNVVTLGSHPTVADATGALVGATLSATTGSGYGAYQTSSTGYGYSMLVVPNNALSGDSTYQLKMTNAAGTVIKSKVVKATVSRGSIDSFNAAWDKSTYSPGEIATLKITAKDAYGNLIADGTSLAGLALTVNTAGFSAVGSACTSSSATVAGVVKCKYAALNDEGSYAYSVDLTTNPDPQSATVGSLIIKSTSTAVTNAEVLAAIVKLIASINQQIAALQKALTKKKK